MMAWWKAAWFPATVLLIVGLWAYTRFGPPPERPAPDMPTALGLEAARELYLSPGGLYTTADITANGGVTAAQKYQGFQSEHDFAPRPGDRVCPVTRTKANPRCTWVVGGKEYQFCCPPCIDEFLQLAKEEPERIRPPEHYTRP